jgi:hypothetical protein
LGKCWILSVKELLSCAMACLVVTENKRHSDAIPREMCMVGV